MIQTWDWLFLFLPQNDLDRERVLGNLESQACTEMKVGEFILIFDFKSEYIYCDCVPNYHFKHKVIPGKASFKRVKEFLLSSNWDVLDQTQMELLF